MKFSSWIWSEINNDAYEFRTNGDRFRSDVVGFKSDTISLKTFFAVTRLKIGMFGYHIIDIKDLVSARKLILMIL